MSENTLLITFWLNDFLSGNLVSFYIVSSAFELLLHPDSVSSFVWSKYGGCFCNWKLSTRLLEKQIKQTISPDATNYIGGPRACSPGKILEIGLSETSYPALPRSNATNLYVYFAELFSESRYSWFPSLSAKIQDSYMFCKYYSWFMIPLPHPTVVWSIVLL